MQPAGRRNAYEVQRAATQLSQNFPGNGSDDEDVEFEDINPEGEVDNEFE
jgi:hypothetical protein